jgi:hypothetical protein
MTATLKGLVGIGVVSAVALRKVHAVENERMLLFKSDERRVEMEQRTCEGGSPLASDDGMRIIS